MKRIVLFAIVLGCAGAHDVKTNEPDKTPEQNALDRALDARDKADDALVGNWYEPNLLKTWPSTVELVRSGWNG